MRTTVRKSVTLPRWLLALVLLCALLLGATASELGVHGALAGNKPGCSYDPLPDWLYHGTPVGVWLEGYCNAGAAHWQQPA